MAGFNDSVLEAAGVVKVPQGGWEVDQFVERQVAKQA
jgi:hypothetical protein